MRSNLRSPNKISSTPVESVNVIRIFKDPLKWSFWTRSTGATLKPLYSVNIDEIFIFYSFEQKLKNDIVLHSGRIKPRARWVKKKTNGTQCTRDNEIIWVEWSRWLSAQTRNKNKCSIKSNGIYRTTKKKI